MNSVSLTFFLIVSNCLAADNSSNSSHGNLNAENNINMDELRLYVDFDVFKYTAELESKCLANAH